MPPTNALDVFAEFPVVENVSQFECCANAAYVGGIQEIKRAALSPLSKVAVWLAVSRLSCTAGQLGNRRTGADWLTVSANQHQVQFGRARLILNEMCLR